MDKPRASMGVIYAYIVKHPGGSILTFLLVLIGVSVLPTSVLASFTLWPQSPDWARLVFQVVRCWW